MPERPLGPQTADVLVGAAIERLRQYGRGEIQPWCPAPVRPPRTKLAEVCQLIGDLDFNVTAEALFRYCCKPGKLGVRSVINTACLVWQTRGELLPTVMVELHERGANRHGFALALAVAWRNSGGTLHRAVGSAARLAELFAYARVDDPLPMVRELFGLPALADSFTAWRGGRGTPEEVASRGLSWSLRRWPASAYALRTEAWSLKLHGSPVILRRDVRREEVLCWIKANDEVILSGPGPYELDATDEAEIQALYDDGKGEIETSKAEAEAFARRLMAMTEDEALQGWTG